MEWPLERNLSIAREMAALAREHNAPTIVGLQGRFSSEIRKMKEIIDSGRIGNVISSSWLAHFGNAGGVESKNVRYFLNREVGGNVFTIGVGHSLEFLNYGKKIPRVNGSMKLTLPMQYWEILKATTACFQSATQLLILSIKLPTTKSSPKERPTMCQTKSWFKAQFSRPTQLCHFSGMEDRHFQAQLKRNGKF